MIVNGGVFMDAKCLNQYYYYSAKVVYAAERLVQIKDQATYAKAEAKFKMLLDNLSSSFHELVNIKKESGLEMYNFANYSGEGFSIVNYKLTGDIEKATQFATNLMEQNSENKLSKPYELGMYIMHLACQHDAIHSGSSDSNKGVAQTQNDKVKDDAVASFSKEKPTKKVKEKVDMFSIFTQYA